MSDLSALEALTLVALSGAAVGAGVYGVILLVRLLPLERQLRKARENTQDLSRFVLEALALDLTGRQSSQVLNELGQRIVPSLHKRFPELALAWVRRRDDGSGDLVVRRGGVWDKIPRTAWRFDTSPLQTALENGFYSWTLASGGAAPGSWVQMLSDQGVCELSLIAWGKPGGSAGVLAVADFDPYGRRIALAAAPLALMRGLSGALASIVDEVSLLAESREELQGGLSAALEELNQTHTRLIQRSRQVKTLHDVALTLSSRTAQAQSALSAVVSIIASALEADFVAFLILDERTGELVMQPGAYGIAEAAPLYKLSLTDEQASSLNVFKSGKPMIVSDAQNDSEVIMHWGKPWDVRALMVVPLKLGDQCIGVVRVGSRSRGFFLREHLEHLGVIADEAAVIVETAILNRRLSETAEQLAALSRMKDDFVSTVSHEFKTPLTVILGFLTLVVDGEVGAIGAEQTRCLTIARNAATRLLGLVTDLLDLSRLEAGVKMEFTTIDIDALIRASVDVQRPSAERMGKTLTLDMSGPLPSVRADARWMNLVVDNLLSNALKFTRPGGKVIVNAMDKGEFVMLSVADDGIGIPAADQGRIFEKFYRASNRTEVNAPGTGLGLAIAHDVVFKHGGKIWFESVEGRGTTFYIVVPTTPLVQTLEQQG